MGGGAVRAECAACARGRVFDPPSCPCIPLTSLLVRSIIGPTERALQHYGSGINSVVVMGAARAAPDDIFLLETGLAASIGEGAHRWVVRCFPARSTRTAF